MHIHSQSSLYCSLMHGRVNICLLEIWSKIHKKIVLRNELVQYLSYFFRSVCSRPKTRWRFISQISEIFKQHVWGGRPNILDRFVQHVMVMTSKCVLFHLWNAPAWLLNTLPKHSPDGHVRRLSQSQL